MWGWILVEKNKTSIIKPQFDFLYLAYDEKYDATKPISFDRPYSTSHEPYMVGCFTDKTKQFSLDGKERTNQKLINKVGFGKKTYLSSLSYKSNRIVTTQKQLADPKKGIYDDLDLFGLDDKSGNEIVRPIYKAIEKGLNDNEFIVEDKNSGFGLSRKFGVIDENGKVIIPATYHSIDFFNNIYYLTETSGHNVGLYDIEGKEIIPIAYKEIKTFLDNLYIVKDRDGLFKIIDATNKTIYTFPKYTEDVYQYEKIKSDRGEVFYSLKFRLKNGYEYWHEHYLIKNLDTRILDQYHIQEIYENHIVQIESDKLIGFYDLNTQKLIKPQFKEVKRYYSNRLIYCKTDKYFDTTVDYNLNITTSKDHITAIINDVIYYEQKGNYGFFNKNNQKTKNTFQTIEVEPFVRSPKLYRYYDNKNKSKAGLVNENGEIVIKANLYDNIYSRSDNFLLSKREIKNKEISQILVCLDKSGETANRMDFVTLSGNKIASMTAPKNNYLVDFISKNGLVLLQSPYEIVFFDLNENKIISKVNSVSVSKDEDGGFTVLVNETSISDFKKVLAQKYSTNGNLISTRIIDRNQNTRTLENWNFYLTQKKENKYGIIGVDEKVIVPFVYDTIMPSIDPIYIAKKDNKLGVIDRENNVLLNFEYDKIETEYLEEYRSHENIHIKEKRAPAKRSFDFIVSKDHKTGIIGPNLKSILPVEYDSFRKNRTLYSNIIARKGKNSMVYNNKGNFLFQVECDSLIDSQMYDQKYYKIYKNNKQGILNQKGIQIFPLLYPKVEKTKFENLFILEKDSKKYIANSKGEIISKGYDEINTSKFNNYLEVKINNKFGLMNNKGTIVIPEIYNTMYQLRGSSYVVISLDNKRGIIDLNVEANKILPIKIPISYLNIEQIVNKNYLIVYNNSKKGVIDLNNKVVIPIIYGSIIYKENRDYFIGNIDNSVINITPDNVIIQVEE